MFRIGILGSDNSHALNFSKMCNIPDEHGNYRYDDVRIVAIHGHDDDPEHTKKVALDGRIENIVSTPEEMLDMVDAIMVVHRNGNYHVDQVMPFIEKGFPVWIDKPLCTTLEDALRLRHAVEKHNTLIAGGSSLKYCKQVLEIKEALASGQLGTLKGGNINFPGDRGSVYAGLFFYGPHLAMILTEIFGYDVQSVYAMSSTPKITSAIARYPDDKLVTLTFNDHCWGNFITVYGTKNTMSLKIDLGGIFDAEFDHFVKLLRDRTMTESLDNMLTGSYILMAVNASLEQQREVAVPVDGFRWGVITDEISQDIEEAAELAARYGVTGLEIRTVFDKAPHELSDEDISRIRAAMEKHNLVCCGISSPFYKCDMDNNDEVAQHQDILARCIDLAKQLGTTNIRGFSFWKNGELTNRLDILKQRFAQPIKMLEDAGMSLLIETEPTTYASNAAALKAVLEAIDHPRVKALWDPGNDIYDPDNEVPFPDGYNIIKDRVAHVHIKDAVKKEDGSITGVRFGEGAVDYAAQFTQLAADGYKGWCVLETHYRPDVTLSEDTLKLPGGSQFSAGGYQASEECLIKWQQLFAQLGLGIRSK